MARPPTWIDVSMSVCTCCHFYYNSVQLQRIKLIQLKKKTNSDSLCRSIGSDKYSINTKFISRNINTLKYDGVFNLSLFFFILLTSSGGNESETGLLYVWCLLGKEKSEVSVSHGNADKVSSLVDVMPVEWLDTVSKDSSVSIFKVVQED